MNRLNVVNATHDIFERMKKFMPFVMLAVFILVLSVPTFAQSVTIDVDTNQFIESINTWLPMAIGITVIGVGIAGAFAIAGFVGNMIIKAFRGDF